MRSKKKRLDIFLSLGFFAGVALSQTTWAENVGPAQNADAPPALSVSSNTDPRTQALLERLHWIREKSFLLEKERLEAFKRADRNEVRKIARQLEELRKEKRINRRALLGIS